MNENIKYILLFFAVSFANIAVVWSLGGYDNDPREEGFVEIIVHKPSGDSRY